ncbi:MAG: replication-associated recombination protein A [Bacilli bacterium]|jgi:putative ATPase
MNEPLAYALRPKRLEDIVGQEHLVGKDKVIAKMLKNKKFFSMILYGNPGVGKNSMAEVIVKESGLNYRQLNAVINNKQDFDMIVEEAKMYKGLLLIMDEFHRLNKDKQDLLLPHLESGLIKVIGLTTSNPYFSINPALRSRCHIFELKDLTNEDLKKALFKSIESKYLKDIKITEKEIDYIIRLANGDLRYAYNLLELSYYSSIDHHITLETLLDISSKPRTYFDKNEDGYYDLLSAFQKSIRGSDVDASLHYLARLIESGDLKSIYRRLSVCAYEDIGLANPLLGLKVNACIEICERLGLPEARIPLATVVIELALSPKSNSSYQAITLALEDLKQGNIEDIPTHLKMNSKDYLYPHNYQDGYVKQDYLPNKLKDKRYYHPLIRNKYEKILKSVYDKLKK